MTGHVPTHRLPSLEDLCARSRPKTPSGYARCSHCACYGDQTPYIRKTFSVHKNDNIINYMILLWKWRNTFLRNQVTYQITQRHIPVVHSCQQKIHNFSSIDISSRVTKSWQDLGGACSTYTRVNKNPSAWNFLSPKPEMTCGTVVIIIRVVLLSPYLRIRAVSLSSIHYNHTAYVLTEDNTFA